MALSEEAARDLVHELIQVRESEISDLETLREYRSGQQPHPQDLNGIPAEARRFIDLSRINMVELAVEIPTQSLYVDGYRPNVPDPDAIEEAAGWQAWQANRMDSRQTAVHRGAFTYGVSYVLVEPSDGLYPVLTGYSPLALTVVYGDDPDWPFAALRVEANGQHFTYTLMDAEAQYRFTSEGGVVHVETNEWEDATQGVLPIVRFPNVEDLDGEITSEVRRLMPVQDQIDVTTFDLMVTQHYQAFIQRYAIGWEARTEQERMKASASRLWTFDDPDVKVGQFTQAQLDGYLKSRDATSQLLAVISQTPPHHLLGDLINLSAEALAAAESGHRRKILMREVIFGESWEQVLEAAEVMMGLTPDPDSQVRWKDTEARSMAQTVDALGKMAQMLGIPPQALWERVPGATQQDIQIWRRMAEETDSIGQLNTLLQAQMGPAPAAPTPPPPGTPEGVIPA